MSKKLNIQVGDVFSWLTAIEEIKGPSKTGSIFWKFKCKCGNYKTDTSSHVYNRQVKSCGCMPKGIEKKDLIGKRFERLLVIGYSHRSNTDKHHYWKCLCDCGEKVTVCANNLGRSTKSCGCLNRELVIKASRNPNNTSTQRQCGSCRKIKPLNGANFGIDSRDLYNYNTTCRDCLSCGKFRIKSLIRCYKRFDLKKKITFSLTFDFVLNLLKEGTECYSCGIKQDSLLMILGLDRIDNSKGHEEDNVLPCCSICNKTRLSNFTNLEMKNYLGPAIKSIMQERMLCQKGN